jgi:hypothetical protein
LLVPLSVLGVAVIISFLAGVVSGAFAVLVISIHRAGHGFLSRQRNSRRGAIARRILTTIRNDGEPGRTDEEGADE